MNQILIEKRLREFLEEDLGPGDVTTEAIVSKTDVLEAIILAKEKGVLAGSIFIPELLKIINPETENLVREKWGCASFSRHTPLLFFNIIAFFI